MEQRSFVYSPEYRNKLLICIGTNTLFSYVKPDYNTDVVTERA